MGSWGLSFSLPTGIGLPAEIALDIQYSSREARQLSALRSLPAPTPEAPRRP